MTSPRLIDALFVLVLLWLGLTLRLGSLDAFGMSPDDGNYLTSARVMRLDRPNLEGSWLTQDWEWAFGERRLTYRHSYIHQLVIRWIYRLGATSAFTVRVVSAILGALTALLLYLFYARNFPERRRTGLVAAALLTGLVIHAWYSRTGWGQTGCTFFWVVYALLGYELFVSKRERSTGSRVAIAAGMCASTLLAYGYHEMIVVHVAGMGIYCFLHPIWQGRGPLGVLQSKATWFFAVSCIPVTAWATTLLNDPFANQHWTGLVQEQYELNYIGYRLKVLEVMFKVNRLDLQITWIVLVLAAAGIVVVYRRDRALARYLNTLLVTSFAIFFFFFRDPYLVRIYLPTIVLLVIFAAEGLVAAASWIEQRAGKVASAGTIFTVVALTYGIGWQTVYGEAGAPLAVTSFYQRGLPNRDPLAPIARYLAENRKPGQLLGISDDSSSYFMLRDKGVPGRMFTGAKWNRKPAEYPDYLVSPQNVMKERRRTVEEGGVYELVETSRLERVGLYAKRLE